MFYLQTMGVDIRRCALLILVLLLFIAVYIAKPRLSLSKSQLGHYKTDIPKFKDSTYRSKLSNGKRRLPDAMLIGVSKCGSTALMFFLSLNPRIRPISGEIEYVCDNDNYDKGLSYYYSKLPKDVPNDHVIIERDGTCWRKSYAERVHNTFKSLNKDIKIVIVACDPVYRAHSWYLHGQSSRHLTPKYNISFEDMAFRDGQVNVEFDGIKTATYDNKYEEWLQYFDRRQILVVDGDLLKGDPYAVIHQMEEFLGVDQVVTRANFYFNETKGFFCKRKTEDATICMSSQKGRYHPEIDPVISNKLHEYFKPHNDRFEQLTRRKFLWNRY